MESKYVFFIGGSGARTLRAFLHACASGAVHEKEIRIMLIDADMDSAACRDCLELYGIYNQLYRTFHEGKAGKVKSPAFQCKVIMYHEGPVSPVPENVSKLSGIVGGAKNGTRAMRWFYTDDEMDLDVSGGFYAHSNIGRIFLQSFCKRTPGGQYGEWEECLKSIAADLKDGNTVRVAVVGSVFGGTGAAGIPQILRAIQDYCEISQDKLHIGGVLLTPYFQAPQEPDAGGTANHPQILRVSSDRFLANTISALRYYDFTNAFENIYLVGRRSLDWVTGNEQSNQNGRAHQNNRPHIVEVFSAMAIKDFLSAGGRWQGGSVMTQILPGSADTAMIGWEYPGFDADFISLADMVRTLTVLETQICPYIKARQNGSKKALRQWYQVFRMEDNVNAAALGTMRKYAECFLEWMYQIQYSFQKDSAAVRRDESIALCGESIETVHKYITARKAGTLEQAEAENMISKIAGEFHALVQPTQNVLYAIGKMFVLLADLGVPGGLLQSLRASGLFLHLYSLCAEKK